MNKTVWFSLKGNKKIRMQNKTKQNKKEYVWISLPLQRQQPREMGLKLQQKRFEHDLVRKEGLGLLVVFPVFFFG